MQQYLTVAQLYTNDKGEPDYEGSISFPIDPTTPARIALAMDMLNIKLWSVQAGMETILESQLLAKIHQRRR